MDDTNIQVDVNALTNELEAFASNMTLKESVRSQMSKNDLDELTIEGISVDNEIDPDVEAIAEIEAYADEQITQFDDQVEEVVKKTEAEDIEIDSNDVIEAIEGEDDLVSMIK